MIKCCYFKISCIFDLSITTKQNIPHHDTDTQIHRYTDTQIHRYTDTQIHRYTDTQIHRYTDTQTSLKETLMAEIESYDQIEPAVPVLIDEAGNIFWVSKEERYVLISKDREGMEKYIDAEHQPVSKNREEGVCNNGVTWLNTDFSSPFHISDFTKQIETITI